jgi:peptidoglycan hydrolase CwlO-like protein
MKKYIIWAIVLCVITNSCNRIKNFVTNTDYIIVVIDAQKALSEVTILIF